MTKREIAIASVTHQLDTNYSEDTSFADLATNVVDQLVRDGLMAGAFSDYGGDPDIASLVDAFQIAFGTTHPLKTDRFAAARLAKRYGVDKTVENIQKLGKTRNEKYAPVVNSLMQFEQKLPQVLRFINGGTNELDV